MTVINPDCRDGKRRSSLNLNSKVFSSRRMWAPLTRDFVSAALVVHRITHMLFPNISPRTQAVHSALHSVVCEQTFGAGTCEKSEAARTCWSTGPLLIPTVIGGRVSTLRAAAVRHLRLLPLERDARQNELYVRLAFTYGLTVPEIVDESGLPVERVQQILGGV